METINNNSNVYILGAGFSRPRGLPLISDFMVVLRDAHEWLVNQGREKEADAIQKVLQFRKESTSAAYRVQIDLENIEELFSLASATNEGLSDQIRLAIAATLDFCSLTQPDPISNFESRFVDSDFSLPERWSKYVGNSGSTNTARFDVPSYEFFCASLLGQLSMDNMGANCLVTLNYDLILEQALTSLGVGFNYCFAQKTVDYDASFHQLRTSGSTPLLKLHGSLNWAFPGKRGRRLTVYDSYSQVRNLGLIPELVPPTWRKSFTPQLAATWERARLEISKATRIVIIGFSMPSTDMHFKYLLAAGLRDNISLREVVFVTLESDRELITNRARELFGELSKRPRVRVVSGGIQGFANGGTMESCVWSIGRAVHTSIQHIQHTW